MGMKFMTFLWLVLFLVYKWVEGGDGGPLALDFYHESCPAAERIVRRIVEITIAKDPRMAASLLRLHFHDCFVMGCDASLLLDDNGGISSEKQAGPNLNSLRGFEVIDEIKYVLEEKCPGVVSCADILAIASRDAVLLRGGPEWGVYLGRRDSLTASFKGANKFIPLPNSSLPTLIENFKQQGLDIVDLVTLSGSHTMGVARCTSFRQRIYDENVEEHYRYHHQRDKTYRRALRSMCPPTSGRDNSIAPLDLATPLRFDNHYFLNIIQGKGLLISDNVLLVDHDIHWEIRKLVFTYAKDQDYFFESFAKSMVKMGDINVITGNEGEIRKNCRFINT